MSFLIREEDIPVNVHIRGETNTVSKARLYVGRETTSAYKQSDLISLSRHKFKGKGNIYRCDVSDRIYFVIKGEITNFRVGAEIYSSVKKGDAIFIPKGTPYTWDWAESDHIIINGPAFLPGSDHILKKM